MSQPPTNQTQQPMGSDMTDAVLMQQVFELQSAVARLQSEVRDLRREIAELRGR